MTQNLLYKWLFIAFVVVACVLGITGFPKNTKELRDNIEARIRLGLDLKGGTHLILQVQVDDAVNAETEQSAERLRELLRKASIPYDDISRADLGQIAVKGIPADKVRDFEDELSSKFDPAWARSRGAQDPNAAAGSSSYLLKLSTSAIAAIREDALKQSLQTIRRRIDEMGLTEPDIREHGRGDYEILVQLPGVDDPARVKDIMQSTAMLQIMEVMDPTPYASPADALQKKNGVLPEGGIVYQSVDRDDTALGENQQKWYILKRTPVITGRDLRNARVGTDENGRPEVDFTIKADGAQRFARYTEANINNSMAVVLDTKIYTVAVIQSRISDNGRITGRFTPERANDLALVLRAGALPAGIKYLEERTVGPSLGADSIRAGLVASISGLVIVVTLMLAYYKLSGINASVSLLLNLLILIAALAYFGAALTLPGIAGVILTIGMAVDSNVLVFERIREELRNGRPVVAAMKAGFEKAWATIVDTHVTTIVSCFFLFLFGTGPIRGFAVTLTIGLAANVFTAVFVSRAIFEWEFSRKREVTISI
jgi:preprotein translocase subunit SecD